MHIYHFDFIKEDGRAPAQTADATLSNLTQAEAHCRDLYDKAGRAMGASKVCVREDENPAIIYFWPRANNASRP
jgi:hypothetical protein